jgi:preprotein translocase subunit SecG
MSIDTILPYVTLGSAVLMIIAILLQQRGASLGAGFGSSGELFTTRRGFDKNLFDVTIVFAVIFCAINFGKYDFAGIAKIGE